MVHWNRRVAIVGVGQTQHKSHRQDVNQIEMINEAVSAALEDAHLSFKDIDMNLHGNMELFEGNYQGDMWHVDGYGGYMKPGIRITTGGTTGGTLCCAAVNLVAAGYYDVVMAIAFEKLEEGNATTGVTNFFDPLWFRWTRAGAIRAQTAEKMIKDYGDEIELIAAKLRVQLADNASRNPYAHLRQKLSIDDVMKSPYLVYPLRFLHMCPQSNGACCIIFASENMAKKITDKPVWYKDHVTCHTENIASGDHEYLLDNSPDTSVKVCAEKLYKRNGITNPLKEIGLFEMYDPHIYWHIDWLARFLMVPTGQVLGMIDRGDTSREGCFPVNPSGGVVSTNPIGATAMVRVAEAALQIRGDAGERQVARKVDTAMASAFGGTGWAILHLLSGSKD
jgi:acetyl-CoA C-acetyltransferase